MQELLTKAYQALIIIRKFNRLKHDTDAYLYEVTQWGLGEREDKPKLEDYE